MKTLSCFIATWITATALLLWLSTHHNTQHFNFLPGTELTLTQHPHVSQEFWHSLWVAGVYSLLNTFIVRFWQMQVELRKKN